jgi:hypothetical protein
LYALSQGGYPLFQFVSDFQLIADNFSVLKVAERVAQERDEPCGEDCSVGYQIRLEK